MAIPTTRSARQTTMDPPITLALPLAEPEPPADCGVCAALSVQRTDARGRGDLSKVSDLNVEIRNHHEPRPKRVR
ncbi:hypothetical protein PV518_41560 [Streptomyces sp. ND04-05B]|uniref:hypothetical protein n=1 Tax=Streptomyces sp. ND04-05B TaxID=3028693 RepID=UPI0029AC4C75|nr:hypothetical protein [Streptomyces sp. ND04-05B]MDX3068563.1 hypothetical protein [Streptomyces sp. ND04-05B]